MMSAFGNRTGKGLARWTAAMLAASTLLFLGAIFAERGGEKGEIAGSDEVASLETSEEAFEAAEHADAVTEGGHDEHDEAGEHLFGINLESPVLTWSFVLVSLVLAAAVWGLASPVTLLLAVALGTVAALLDGREVVLQFGRGNAGVMVLATLTALAHTAVAVLGVMAWEAIASPSDPLSGRDRL